MLNIQKNILSVGVFLFACNLNASELIPDNILKCASGVPERITLSIVAQESSFKPFAIGVNRAKVNLKQPKSHEEAVSVAKRLISNGYNIDMGYAQINSANLKWLGLSVDQVFNPCTNLKAMQFILSKCYLSAKGDDRMQKAFSCYNTGNHQSGFKNGYVSKVTAKYKYFSNISSQQNSSSTLVLNQKIKLPSGSDNLAKYAESLNSENFDNKTHDTIANITGIVENKKSLLLVDSDKNKGFTGDAFSQHINDAFY